ncbi:hypothetical protein [Paenibacillus sanfengchensis]|uniref:hypothetical protein n=1 Tax=Paenibacillus sanfengchensis TaxID=3119819 RepID=UPI002FE18AED
MNIKQFRHDLARGLGSIILYLKQSPTLSDKYVEAIYEACIKNTAYDPQCDISRENYLWEAIQLSKASDSLQERILRTLESDIEEDDWDFLQVYRLAKLFALNGNPTALATMKKAFRYREGWNGFLGGEEIIEAGGEQGFLFVAEQIGKGILSSDYIADKFLLEFAYEHLGKDNVNGLLVSRKHANIQAFLRSATREPKEDLSSKPIHEASYDELKASLGNLWRPLYSYLKWGMKATEEDLLRAANDLLKEKNTKKLEAYLYIFGGRVFPLDPQKIMDFLQSKHPRLRSAAIRVLHNMKDERIHRLAIQLMGQQSTELEALNLFIHNFMEDDLQLLERVVFKRRNKDSFHNVGFSILKIFEKNPTLSCQKILIELYQRGLCSICRKRCVAIMIANHILPTSLRDEIKYDCNPEIRNLLE